MQATTAHLPTIVFREARAGFYPFVLAILCILVVAMTGLAERLHQIIDPVYRHQIESEQAANQALDAKLNKVDQSRQKGR